MAKSGESPSLFQLSLSCSASPASGGGDKCKKPIERKDNTIARFEGFCNPNSEAPSPSPSAVARVESVVQLAQLAASAAEGDRLPHSIAPPVFTVPASGIPAGPAPECSTIEGREGAVGTATGRGSLSGRPPLPDVDAQVRSSLDKLFKAEKVWQAAVARGPTELELFQVHVPQPYPGVQYRRSKNLEDTYLRYAKNGITVAGRLEDRGEWLRLSGDVFLPMRIGGIMILEPLHHQYGGRRDRGSGEAGSSSLRCWTCCPETSSELVVDQAILLKTPDDVVTAMWSQQTC